MDWFNSIITTINNDIRFVAYSVITAFMGVLMSVFKVYLNNVFKAVGKTNSIINRLIIFIIFIIGLIFPISILFASFVAWSGWWFWVSQIVGWLLLINFIAFSFMANKLEQLPNEQDLFKKQR